MYMHVHNVNQPSSFHWVGTTPILDRSIRAMTALLEYIDLFSVDIVKLDGHLPTQVHPWLRHCGEFLVILIEDVAFT